MLLDIVCLDHMLADNIQWKVFRDVEEVGILPQRQRATVNCRNNREPGETGEMAM